MTDRTPPPPGFTPREPYDESMTSTLLIPFAKHLHKPETEYDTVIVAVPADLVPPPPASPGIEPAMGLHLLARTHECAEMMANTVREAQWWITRDPEVVKQRGEGDRCPACLAGVDQALTAMRNEPGVVMAIGRLSWCG